jgi:hypothetical protein
VETPFATTVKTAARIARTSPLRKEFTVKITRTIRTTLDGLAQTYNLYTPEGTTRDAEIVRVLLVCALAEGMEPHEQAAIALYVNGLMLVSQSLWLGLHDVRADLAETMQVVIGPRSGVGRHKHLGNPVRDPDRDRFHVKIDDWIRDQLVAMARRRGHVRSDGTVLDAPLVAKLIEHAVENPDVYEEAFTIYARGITQVRVGLIEGLTLVRDALREAVTKATGGLK